jgi:hypothetical protein
MTSAKQESERLLNAVLPLAERMLKEYGEFYPYAGYLKPGGQVVDVGAEDPETDHPKSKDLIHVLRDSLRELARTGKCVAVAIVFDVTVNLPSSAEGVMRFKLTSNMPAVTPLKSSFHMRLSKIR